MAEVTGNVNKTWIVGTETGTAARTGMRERKEEMRAATKRGRKSMTEMKESTKRGRRKRIGKKGGHREITGEEMMMVITEKEVGGEKREGIEIIIALGKGTTGRTAILKAVMGNGVGKRTDITESVYLYKNIQI